MLQLEKNPCSNEVPAYPEKKKSQHHTQSPLGEGGEVTVMPWTYGRGVARVPCRFREDG